MARQSAEQRHREQRARRAQPKRAYAVTIICNELGMRETVTVQAVDEWLARTEAMRICTFPLCGQLVTYQIAEVR
jgi:hypothetical protein